MNMNIKIGLCYRNWLHEKYLNQILDIVDIIEIMPDITDVEEIKLIKKSCEEKNIDLSIHSLRSNIGSVEGIHKDETDKYFFVNYYCDSVYFSDHMAFSHILGNYLSSVNQLIYNEENIRVVQKNIAQLEHKFSDTPVLIENITQNNLRKDSTMRESDFWHSVFQNLGSNVGIMLDITNM
ncbi:DUF692 family protein [Bacillus aquiflavi]|nr:DUF692 family protein [Bacillus aquiflavi]